MVELIDWAQMVSRTVTIQTRQTKQTLPSILLIMEQITQSNQFKYTLGRRTARVCVCACAHQSLVN